ncbi:MBL fold metallo-hydrolase [Novosphingobium sp. Leaf2]|uniref:MBL fold metallo-hydrolase n=1 Tax=Novosphingobium sp. Leaf2 TaxID=1735670 RepID=UPI0009E69417|nr:MBL fold metallo-hydrolase [Novosphingobium sp. Leaf2]
MAIFLLKNHKILISSIVASTVLAAPPATAEESSYVGIAKLFPGIQKLCEPVPKPYPNFMTNYVYKFPESFPEAKVFDNLYYLGNHAASSWAIKTEEGIILIDTLDNEEEAKFSIEGGLKKLGLDPSTIKFIIITHGHIDHYGGARYLAEKYRARVIMGEKDWEKAAQRAKVGLPAGFTTPSRDISVKSRDQVTLGSTTVKMIITPGHTRGTISMIFPVTDKGVRRNVAFWGGMGLNLGPNIEPYSAYAKSADLMKSEAYSNKAQIFLSNHAKFDYADKKIEINKNTNSGNAFTNTTPEIVGAFGLLAHCAQSQIEFIKQDGVNGGAKVGRGAE